MQYKPDFVVIEFGVNDNLQDWQKEAYASLVRRVLTADWDPAVMLFFMKTNDGVNAQTDQIPIGEFYDVYLGRTRRRLRPPDQQGARHLRRADKLPAAGRLRQPR